MEDCNIEEGYNGNCTTTGHHQLRPPFAVLAHNIDLSTTQLHGINKEVSKDGNFTKTHTHTYTNQNVIKDKVSCTSYESCTC